MRTAILAAAVLVLGAAVAPDACAHAGPHGRRAHVSRAAFTLSGASLLLDPVSGNYRVSYYVPGDLRKTLHHAVFVPSTKIDPVLESEFEYGDDREVHYRYHLGNGPRARQALVSVVLEPVSELSALALPPTQPREMSADRRSQLEALAATALLTPAGWNGRVTTSAGGGLRIAWRYSAGARGRALVRGGRQAGFGLPADDLPGIVLAKLTGDAPVLKFDSAWPAGDIGDRLAYLATHDYVTRPVAVPAIAIPEPYDSARLLDSIRSQTHDWIAYRLLDPLFSVRLDHHLHEAAGALRRGDAQGARFELEDLRTLLAVQQPSLDTRDKHLPRVAPTAAQIDPLAARVLDFNLNYVLKRMGREKP
jgi:hypothetical protein